MRTAIKDWLSQDCLIATTLTEEKDFHLKVDDPWHFIATAIDRFDGEIPKEKLIFIGVPRIYKHMPLFCAALYHELGHYVDMVSNITGTTLLLDPPPAGASENVQIILCNHRREFFADLFAACYVGSAIAHSLEQISPDGARTVTHPPTAERLEVIRCFLAGEEFEELEMFQRALAKLNLPELSRRFETPEIDADFDDIRPHRIENNAQLHGIMAAGWSYMAKLAGGQRPPWAVGMSPLDSYRVVNDLAEKSIRNASIRHLWAGDAI